MQLQEEERAHQQQMQQQQHRQRQPQQVMASTARPRNLSSPGQPQQQRTQSSVSENLTPYIIFNSFFVKILFRLLGIVHLFIYKQIKGGGIPNLLSLN